MKIQSFYIFLSLIFCFVHFASAQNIDPIRFNHLTVDHGLSQNSVRCLLQDSKGFMWFGTEEGLNRYDGYSFQVLQNRDGDSTSLSTNDVRSIIEDQHGKIWVGTTHGLNILDRNNSKFIRVQLPIRAGHSVERNFIYSLYEDRDGDIWIGTRDGLYLFHHQESRFEFLDHFLSVPLSQVMSFIQDDTGKIWIGTEEEGLFQVDKDSWVIKNYTGEVARLLPGSDGLVKAEVASILQDRNGIIWVGTYSGLLKGTPLKEQQADGPSYEFEPFFPSLEGFESNLNMIRCMVEDDDGLIWVGTYEGLLILDPQQGNCSGYQHRDDLPFSLSANFIRSIGKDSRGDIWMGTIQGGINVCHRSNFGFEHDLADWARAEMNGQIVQGFSEDAEGNLWVATRDGGLSFIDLELEKITNFAHDPKNKNSLSINKMRCLLTDRSGTVWMGTYYGGLNRYDPKTGRFKQYLHNPGDSLSINEDMINAILEDRNGNIWVATHYGGLDLYDPQMDGFIHFTHDRDNANTLSSNIIVSLFEDKDQNLWIGTRHSGLNRMNLQNREITRFQYTAGKPGTISSNAITAITQDSRGVIWVGTEDAGLNRYDAESGHFENFRKEDKDGLPSDAIHGILEDDKGKLWLSTNKGLCHFDPKGLTFTNHDQTDGLSTNQFIRNAYLKTKNGELLFGSINGFTMFRPEHIGVNNFEPPVYITGFRLFNEEVSIDLKSSPLSRHISETSSITLKNTQSVFSFDYVALNYVRSAKNQYAYRMEGLEEDWNYVGDKRSVDYTTLPPGDYTFQVKASNNSDIWNATGAAINLTILPPWYKTVWAYGIYGIAFAFLLLLYRSYTLQRVKEKHKLKLAKVEKEKVEEINKMKLKFFTDISHELRTPLTLILGPLEQLFEMTKSNSKANRYLSIIRTNAEYLLRLINELLEFRKMEANKMKLDLQKADIGVLANIVRQAFLEQARQNLIDFFLVNNLEESKGLFDIDKVQKILYNLLSNAFKFTAGNKRRQVSLCLSNIKKGTEKFVRLEVIDNGIGIPPEEAKHIFNPFYQGGHKIAHIGASSGIGLALTKRLVELHNGNIQVYSQVDIGTTFVVDLPMETTRHLEKESASTPHHARPLPLAEAIKTNIMATAQSGSIAIGNEESKPLILLTEDNPQMRQYLMDCLEEDYRVIEGTDGQEGWEKALALLPDLIVTDVMMPNSDGVEFCRKLKSDIRTSHIPVIFLTARTALEHRIEGLMTGADAYLTKPFSCKHLQAMIESILTSRRNLWKSFKCGKLSARKENTLGPLDQRFLNSIGKVVEANLKNSDFTVEEFVKEVAMSRSYFHRKLKALTGLSASEFIKDRRLQRAAQLLLENKLTVSEIAYEAGFSSPNYFGRCFRKKYGVNPTEYKERNLLV